MPNPEEPNEKTLVAAYWRVRARLHSALSKMLHGSEDAQDILQDAFIRLWRRPQPRLSEDEATALTSSTAKHLAIDSWRRHTRHATTTIDEERDDAPDDDCDTQEEQRLRYEAVRRIMSSRLTAQQQQIMTMRDIQGIPYADIALQLSMDETAVRMCLSRARKTIRKIYEEEISK